MMLAQLQSLYPTASLISELVQIDHGKYIVRASVQIEGITRATGMAAAPTVEEAEDQARSRALMVLGITTTPQPQIESLSEAKSMAEAKTTKSSDVAQTKENFPASTPPRIPVSAFTPSPIDTPNLETQPSTPIPPTVSATPTIENNSQDFEQNLAVSPSPELRLDIQPEDFGVISNSQSEHQPLPEIGSSNVTLFPQRSHNNTPNEVMAAPAPTTRKKQKSEPVDQSDDIAKIGVEMQRLGWTTEQGRDYLIQTYGKRSRHLLDSEELRDFLKYLESQPTPVDPLAGF